MAPPESPCPPVEDFWARAGRGRRSDGDGVWVTIGWTVREACSRWSSFPKGCQPLPHHPAILQLTVPYRKERDRETTLLDKCTAQLLYQVWSTNTPLPKWHVQERAENLHRAFRDLRDHPQTYLWCSLQSKHLTFADWLPSFILLSCPSDQCPALCRAQLSHSCFGEDPCALQKAIHILKGVKPPWHYSLRSSVSLNDIFPT